ncbi:heterokaryon incompatibility protein [Colletotrichum asianum]
MSRWHEPTCIQPNVAVVGGLPCCSWCYAVASIDDITFAPPLVPSNPPH